MRQAEKVIITCAVTGAVHTPTMSPHLPISPEEITDSAIDAVEAGASILHLHARDPDTGQPTQDPEIFRRFLPQIKQRTDAVVNITTGGGLHMPFEERLAPANRFKPEVTSLNMGTMNFCVADLATSRDRWKFDWEEPYLANTKSWVYQNTFAQIERIMLEIGQGYGTKFEFECYDVGHLYSLAYFVEQRLVEPPFLVQCILGVLGGIGADPENLTHMVRIADKLFGDDYYLSVIATGKSQMRLGTMSALMGGNVRVGLEDSLYIGRGELATSNAQQVAKIRRVIEELGLDVASPAEARAMLKLKGGDHVDF